MIKQRSLWTYILLTIITCGIYSLYFFYRYTQDLNAVCQGDGQESPNYILVFLLSLITCGIYRYYWLYKQGNRLQEAAPRYGMVFQEDGTAVLLWELLGMFIFVGPFIALHILIKNMNAVANVYNANGGAYRPPYYPPYQGPQQ